MNTFKNVVLVNTIGFIIGYTISSSRVLYLRHKLKKNRIANKELCEKIIANTLSHPIY